MTDIKLIENLPRALDRILQDNLAPNEKILVALKGAFKEALVCTDRRVLILKTGFMTGHIFGNNMFQLSYANIAGAQVNTHFVTGYFELSAGGMQNTAKSYWSNEKGSDPAKAPNCISLNSKLQATSFRNACAFIMERIEQSRRGPVAPSPANRSEPDVPASLERLWKLKTDGAINQAEYDDAKDRLLHETALEMRAQEGCLPYEKQPSEPNAISCPEPREPALNPSPPLPATKPAKARRSIGQSADDYTANHTTVALMVIIVGAVVVGLVIGLQSPRNMEIILGIVAGVLLFLFVPISLIAAVVSWVIRPNSKLAALSGRVALVGGIGAVGSLVLFGLIFGESPKTAEVAKPKHQAPGDQRDFVATVIAARDAYRIAGNDMAKGAARVEPKRQLCQALRSFIIDRWEGTISGLTSNNDGRGVLEIAIGPAIYVKTWNNAVSDYTDGTLLSPSSALYNTAVSMRKGQKVIFSGTLLSGDKDCAKESNISQEGSMTEPEFIMRFSDIATLRE